MSSPFWGLRWRCSIVLDALSQNPLVGLEGGARGNGDDLALAAGDLRELETLSKLRLQDDVGEVPEHRNELGDVDELGEPGDRFVEARGLQFEVRGRLAEGGGPGVEFLNAALGEHFRLEEPLDREHLAERIGDRRAGGGDQRAHGRALRAEEPHFDVEVPGALRPVRIDALQCALVGGEGELAELLHLIDDDLVDADLGDRQAGRPCGLSAPRASPPCPSFIRSMRLRETRSSASTRSRRST